jgi:ABC-2 type transport system ATP-binding protein
MDYLIELDRIGRTFGQVAALTDVTLRLKPGRIGLLGPNGAGKSTLLKILMGLLTPTGGSGHVLGHAISPGGDGEGDFELRRLIGFMPEADALVPGLRGIDYVCLAGELYGLPRKQAIRRAHEVLSYLDLEEARYRRLEEYSTGMKQRLKLAQSLVHDPPMLLLDEPTSGLDPAGRDVMLRLMLELGRDFGKSLIVSTHLLADVETVCEQVVILIGGGVRGQGTVSELCARRHDRFSLRVLGEVEAYRSALQSLGVRVLSYNAKGELRLSVPEGWHSRDFFATANAVGVVVRTLTPDDETLEEMFLRTAQAMPANGNCRSGRATIASGEGEMPPQDFRVGSTSD